MKCKYRNHTIVVNRVEKEIKYSILSVVHDVCVYNTINAKDTSVYQMIHNCKQLIDDSLLPPLHEFHARFLK